MSSLTSNEQVLFTSKELTLFKSLNTPRKIQEFLNQIPINFEPEGDTCLSPRRVLKENRAHCIEGAMLAALILRMHGHKPLLVDLESSRDDFDHVIAVFQQHGHWGAISKTNHAVLRYRGPVYKTIRELVLSYFHEYFDKNGKKTLRKYTEPVNLAEFDYLEWMTTADELWEIADYLAKAKHFSLLNRKQIALLKKPDRIEMDFGDVVEWKKEKI
ncbi:hypothetical protein HYX13_04790 [Candidatus Woesearchaeota archaeon]|nr:hypothetical protein [Candidatus Woesearchaeota archaeon]